MRKAFALLLLSLFVVSCSNDDNEDEQVVNYLTSSATPESVIQNLSGVWIKLPKPANQQYVCSIWHNTTAKLTGYPEKPYRLVSGNFFHEIDISFAGFCSYTIVKVNGRFAMKFTQGFIENYEASNPETYSYIYIDSLTNEYLKLSIDGGLWNEYQATDYTPMEIIL